MGDRYKLYGCREGRESCQSQNIASLTLTWLRVSRKLLIHLYSLYIHDGISSVKFLKFLKIKHRNNRIIVVFKEISLLSPGIVNANPFGSWPFKLNLLKDFVGKI